MSSKGQGLPVSSAPFVHVRESTATLVLLILICLVPSLAWAVSLFGWNVLLVVGVSAASAMAAEGSLEHVAETKHPGGRHRASDRGAHRLLHAPRRAPVHPDPILDLRDRRCEMVLRGLGGPTG
ncbi:MAG: RnfABCDGE type electron transport complex subunit D [Bacillus subtilis]|nr:RnfABCDGE type electron transport complex subunit D [Bacillus subtilis]